MPRLVNAVPKYRKHSSGNARVTINGRDYLLGPYGTAVSKREYDRLIAEFLESGRSASFGVASMQFSMAMLIVDYLKFAKGYYGSDKNSEFHRIKYAIRPAKELYASIPVTEFGPSQFRVVRQRMVDSDLSRGVVNSQMKRLVRMFKWAASEGKMPASIYETLRLVSGLKRGRTEARETSPVMPVSLKTIEATLKHLPPTIADMVNLQLLTGCRPGEICKLTPGMIPREGDVWVAVLGEHKTAHHGHESNLDLGPKSQILVAPYLLRGADDYLFRPCDTVKKQRAKAAASRATPLSCGNREGTNRKRTPKRPPGIQYDPIAYGRAIKRAADHACERGSTSTFRCVAPSLLNRCA